MAPSSSPPARKLCPTRPPAALRRFLTSTSTGRPTRCVSRVRWPLSHPVERPHHPPRAPQGVTSVTFPSRSLGIAVGLGPGGTATVDQAPSILITLDAALTWLAVTGFSGPLPTAAAHVAPDLISVACATRNLCWTVGGYYPTKSSAQTSWQLSSTAGILPTTGMLAISTNGGTMWSWATLPTGTGALAAVAADGTGKSVYAVGHPFWATTGASHVASAAVASPFGPYAPTILMSNSYGVNGTWALQVAPVLPGATYSLTGLAVLRGSAAFASGGNPWGYTNLGQAGSVTLPTATGVIIGTQNGGFSWTVQVRSIALLARRGCRRPARAHADGAPPLADAALLRRHSQLRGPGHQRRAHESRTAARDGMDFAGQQHAAGGERRRRHHRQQPVHRVGRRRPRVRCDGDGAGEQPALVGGR